MDMKKAILVMMAGLLALPVSLLAAGPKKAAEITVISYNIRVGGANDGTNSWQYRYPASPMMIQDQKPDIFGLQEALDYQQGYLEEILKDYKCVGVGREDGKHKGEHMSIFWNKKRIKMVKWGTYWLSETPEKPTKGWDADCIRTATWTLMKDKQSGKMFYYVNTHLDHVGWEARKNGLALIVERIGQMNKEGYPMILTGDFNMTIDRPEFDDLKKIMDNAREVAFQTDHKGTYNGWGKSSSVIDYIWFKGFSSCTEFQTITKPYFERAFISDHFPVKATLVF